MIDFDSNRRDGTVQVSIRRAVLFMHFYVTLIRYILHNYTFLLRVLVQHVHLQIHIKLSFTMIQDNMRRNKALSIETVGCSNLI